MKTKFCRRCERTLPVEDFAKNRSAGDGLQTYCKTCSVKATRASQIKRGPRPRVPSTPESRAVDRDATLLRKYGMTRSEIDELALSQGGCLICGTMDPPGRGWHVDHDHACCPGQYTCGDCIRGVLCSECNTGLGKFKDSPDFLRRAASYLISHRDVRSVVTVGTFDLLHSGHLHLFQFCRSLVGPRGRVVVGVNSSEFVQTFKKPPVQSTDERVSMVQANSFVDKVVVNESASLASLLEEESPVFLAIGSDWAPPKDYYTQIGVTPQWLDEHSITLLYLDRNSGHSSTELKERVRDH